MIIKGNQCGGSARLTAHLLNLNHNEHVVIEAIEGFWHGKKDFEHFRRALLHMEKIALALRQKRNFYHVILAPQQDDRFGPEHLKSAVNLLAENVQLKNHPYVAVRHNKKGRQHFHIIFDLISPRTGLISNKLPLRKKEWQTARQLEKLYDLKPVISLGRSIRRWEYERSKRSGIDPLHMRKTLTAIYKTSQTSFEFLAKLRAADLFLTRGRHTLVLVDKAGDVHGLIRRIEGGRLAVFKERFPELFLIDLPSLLDLRKRLRATRTNRIITGRLIANRVRLKREPHHKYINPSFIPVVNQSGLPLRKDSLAAMLMNVFRKSLVRQKKKRFIYTAVPMVHPHYSRPFRHTRENTLSPIRRPSL